MFGLQLWSHCVGCEKVIKQLLRRRLRLRGHLAAFNSYIDGIALLLVAVFIKLVFFHSPSIWSKILAKTCKAPLCASTRRPDLTIEGESESGKREVEKRAQVCEWGRRKKRSKQEESDNFVVFFFLYFYFSFAVVLGSLPVCFVIMFFLLSCYCSPLFARLSS